MTGTKLEVQAANTRMEHVSQLSQLKKAHFSPSTAPGPARVVAALIFEAKETCESGWRHQTEDEMQSIVVEFLFMRKWANLDCSGLEHTHIMLTYMCYQETCVVVVVVVVVTCAHTLM